MGLKDRCRRSTAKLGRWLSRGLSGLLTLAIVLVIMSFVPMEAYAATTSVDTFAELKSACQKSGTVQITASDMGVLLYTAFGFVKNKNFMQYRIDY